MLLDERWMEVSSPFAGQVHGAERMLKARVFGGGEYPPGALQLMDPAQPLQPGVVDQLLLGGSRHSAGFGHLDIAIDGVAGEVDSAVFLEGAGHRADSRCQPAPFALRQSDREDTVQCRRTRTGETGGEA